MTLRDALMAAAGFALAWNVVCRACLPDVLALRADVAEVVALTG